MKEFFKPTIAKFILMLLIPFYFGVVGELILGADGQSATVASNLQITFLPFVVLVFGAIAFWGNFEKALGDLNLLSTGQKIWYFFLEIVLPLMINYLLACLIVYIYHKIRKREKENTGSDKSRPSL